jgi:hypothetical protein
VRHRAPQPPLAAPLQPPRPAVASVATAPSNGASLFPVC